MTLSINQSYKQGPAWYRGDFHAHTNHSDGTLDPAGLLAEAREKQLDFFSITDHNAISAYDQFGPHDDMLIIPGIEVTMKYGHFNVFGIERQSDWIDGLPAEEDAYERHMETGEAQYTPNELMQLTRAQGLYNSINHPLLGVWTWHAHETDLRLVDFVEIWNDPSWPGGKTGNPNAVAMWTRWLNAGHRITAIGGTDFHHPTPKPQKDGSVLERDHLNLPTTHVYAGDLSASGILRGLTQRRAIMSMGPDVTLGATLGERSFMIGDDVGATDGTILFEATATGAGSLRVQLVCNGAIIAEVAGDGAAALVQERAISAENPQWFRIDVRDDKDQFLAVTNPIFCGPTVTPVLNRFGDFV